MTDENGGECGFTIIELLVTMVVFATVAVSTAMLLVGYVSMSGYAQSKAVALTVATEKIEYLQSIPYNSLAIDGGAIAIKGTPLPATEQIKKSAREFTVKTEINYVDDAFDGCFNYPTEVYYTRCVNGPPKPDKPVDNNPRDYKMAQVRVLDRQGRLLATLSARFVAKVAEVASDTSMIDVKVTDTAGNDVADALVRIQSSSISPAVDQSMNTDAFGSALFMDATASANPDYVVSVSKPGYSSLTTIASSGSLIPRYPNTTAILQNVSRVTLVIDPVSSSRSLRLVAVDTGGNRLANQTLELVGGVKLYTDPNDEQYSSSMMVTTDADGELVLGGLTPGDYWLRSPGRYVVAIHSARPGGSLQPFSIVAGDSPLPGMTTMQEIKVFISNNPSHPVIYNINPESVTPSATGYLPETSISVTGRNLMGATLELWCGAVRLVGAPMDGGVDSSESISRMVDLTAAPLGPCQVVVQKGGMVVTQGSLAPSDRGGFYVQP